jgi:UDP:flavonoid glycosyltransferase YjiC (YdhE family)
MENAKRILVCPLNWGLGHASRCIPIIHQWQSQGKEIVIASDGYPQTLLQQEFPQLKHIHFPSYQITYSKGQSQIWAMLKALPKLIVGIVREHRQLKRLIAEHQIDTVLSDNRFGLWNKHIHSVYMTHQLMIKMPRMLKFLEPVAWFIHRCFIHQYNVCLIPDKLEDGGFAGDLTHKYRLPNNARFIGIQSRFSIKEKQAPQYQIAAILSGVEPQRSIFEKILIDELSKKDLICIIVQGLPSTEKTNQQINKLRIVSHLDSQELEQLFIDTPTIICRSGYSTIMDLLSLHKTAILVPTPGQTEQEYLAKYLAEKGLFKNVYQQEFSHFLLKL